MGFGLQARVCQLLLQEVVGTERLGTSSPQHRSLAAPSSIYSHSKISTARTLMQELAWKSGTPFLSPPCSFLATQMSFPCYVSGSYISNLWLICWRKRKSLLGGLLFPFLTHCWQWPEQHEDHILYCHQSGSLNNWLGQSGLVLQIKIIPNLTWGRESFCFTPPSEK